MVKRLAAHFAKEALTRDIETHDAKTKQCDRKELPNSRTNSQDCQNKSQTEHNELTLMTRDARFRP
jgi:hypothetical protein